MEVVKMKNLISLVFILLSLSGCALQAIDDMNAGLSDAMGQHISSVESALGKPAEVARKDDRTLYRWFSESHIEPCNVEVWADMKGLVRKTSWSGYRGACVEFAKGLKLVYPGN